ncbi:MAG: hypothetical protein IKI99_00515 [Firmicutes bacterium]|nr:hypothetical protein [Bacillota bacterium]
MKDIIGFFGGDSQAGTTMIAWSFAEKLSEKEQRVLLVFGSGGDDQAVMPAESGHSIDALKASMRSGRVEREELMQCLEKKKQLWILPGIQNGLAAGQFLEDTFEILLKSIEEDFDYVVIDGGSDIRLGLTVSALNISTCRYYVVTQQSKTLHRYLRCRQQFLEPLGLRGRLILNKYRMDPALFLKKDVMRLTAEEPVAVIPYVNEGWQIEMEQKNLLLSSRVSREIERLTMPFVQEEKKERKWRKPFI